MKTERKIMKKIEKYKKKLAKIKKRDRRRRSPGPGSSGDSVVSVASSSATLLNSEHSQPSSPNNQADPEPATDFLEDLLNMNYEVAEKFEGNLHDKISLGWKHILLNGLKKEEKENILSTYKIPRNCTLLEAPALNDEVKNILTDSAKTRALEAIQNQLGLPNAQHPNKPMGPTHNELSPARLPAIK